MVLWRQAGLITAFVSSDFEKPTYEQTTSMRPEAEAEAERPGGGFLENKGPSIDPEDQGNMSDDPSWEKHEVVDATKFSTVRKTPSSTQALAAKPDTSLAAETAHCHCWVHMHFQWKSGIINALRRSRCDQRPLWGD